MMPLVAGVTESEQAAGKKLPLNRKHVAFVVWHLIVREEVRRGIYGNVIAEVDFRVRIHRRRIQRRLRKRESLTGILAVSCSDERRVEQWRGGAQIVISIW